MNEYNNKMSEIIKKGKPAADTLIDMLEEASKYDIPKRKNKKHTSNDVKHTTEYDLLLQEIYTIKNRLNKFDLLEIRIMNIESRLGTLEHYTRGYEQPRQIPQEHEYKPFTTWC